MLVVASSEPHNRCDSEATSIPMCFASSIRFGEIVVDASLDFECPANNSGIDFGAAIELHVGRGAPGMVAPVSIARLLPLAVTRGCLITLGFQSGCGGIRALIRNTKPFVKPLNLCSLTKTRPSYPSNCVRQQRLQGTC